MASKPASPAPDPFREWLRTKNSSAIATAIGVSPQTINSWKRGKGVRPRYFEAITTEAAKDGVTLTTAQLAGA